jgi:prepilin-type N-terminal cleavage/methylation domain-containing protein
MNNMHATRSARGFTLIEVLVAASLAVGVLGSAIALLDTSRDLAQSVNDQRVASTRVDRALHAISEEFRKGSLATAQHPDGTTFSDGDTDMGFQIAPVEGWNGSALLGDAVSYRFIREPGASEGDLVRQELSVQSVIARSITSFSVARAGSSFVFEITAESGFADDRRRKATGTLRVMARNP